MRINKFKEIYKKNEFNSYKGERETEKVIEGGGGENEIDKRNKNRQ